MTVRVLQLQGNKMRDFGEWRYGKSFYNSTCL